MCMPVKMGEVLEQARFGTDLGTCGIDNRASASVSPFEMDFTGPLTEEKRIIQGF
jgi:hypothetical protein